MAPETEVSKAPRNRSYLLSASLGATIGIVALHPLSMAANMHLLGIGHGFSASDWVDSGLQAFSAQMWPMAAFFGLLGGLFGLLVAMIRNKAVEIERQRATTDVLHDLTVTMSHYIRNANTPIAGFGKRLMEKTETTPEQREKLGLMVGASLEIEAVLACLEELERIDRTEPIGKTQIKILDLKDRLKDHHNRLMKEKH